MCTGTISLSADLEGEIENYKQLLKLGPQELADLEKVPPHERLPTLRLLYRLVRPDQPGCSIIQ